MVCGQCLKAMYMRLLCVRGRLLVLNGLCSYKKLCVCVRVCERERVHCETHCIYDWAHSSICVCVCVSPTLLHTQWPITLPLLRLLVQTPIVIYELGRCVCVRVFVWSHPPVAQELSHFLLHTQLSVLSPANDDNPSIRGAELRKWRWIELVFSEMVGYWAAP